MENRIFKLNGKDKRALYSLFMDAEIIEVSDITIGSWITSAGNEIPLHTLFIDNKEIGQITRTLYAWLVQQKILEAV